MSTKEIIITMKIISNSVLFYNFFVFPFFIGIHLNSSFQFKFLHHEVLRYLQDFYRSKRRMYEMKYVHKYRIKKYKI